MRPGHYDVVTAVIPGTDGSEEIVFSCHLCHQKPGANDNASGAAAILEAARALNALIRRGEIERPRRTIRFIWPPEINGTLAERQQTTVVEVLRRFIKLGLLATEIQERRDAALIIREGDREREILLL